MAVYRQVYDSRHLQADCLEPGSAPEPYTPQSSMGYFYLHLYQLNPGLEKKFKLYNSDSGHILPQQTIVP